MSELIRQTQTTIVSDVKEVSNEADALTLVKIERNVSMQVELIMPVALEKGSKFAIREGGLTVGAGVITEILD